MKTDFFFVYGTLKVDGVFSKEFNDLRISSEKATLKGMDLYNIGWFPGIIPGTGFVIGELHEYSSPALVVSCLNRIEGCDGTKHALFRRERRPIITFSGKEVEAIVYIFNQKITEDLTLIENGVWNNEN